MKILLLNTGRFANAKAGTERVLCNMANAMIDRGHEVRIVNYHKNMGESPFPLNEKVTVMGVAQSRLTLFERIKRCFQGSSDKRHEYGQNILDAKQAKLIAQVIAEMKADIVICYQPTGVRILHASSDPVCPVISMFHFDPKTIIRWYDGKTLRALEQCSRVQVLLESYISILKEYIKSDNIVYIPNVVPQFGEARADLSSKVILHIGRFDKKQKRQHLLIEAFAKIAGYDEEWTVELWGEEFSEYFGHCKQLVEKLGLQDRVKFCGTTDNIIEEIKRASIFCFPSACEGFGLAMTEAMSMGLPAVGYKGSLGVKELIEDKHNGILCDDGVEPLADALLELIKDEEKRKRYGDNAKQDMKQYAPEVVWDMWEQLMEEAVHEYKARKQ